MRTLVIGDIHGGYRALQQVLDRSDFNYEKDRLICLGDYVDGWSESAQVIQTLINMQNKSSIEHIFIRGNHDAWCEEWINYGNAKSIWLTQGGAATFESYQNMFQGIVPDSHRKFFNQLHNYYVDEENRGFVHGGFISRKGLGHDPHQSDYYWDRDMWQLALLQHDRFHDGEKVVMDKMRRFEKHKEVYIGHTSTANWNCKPHYPEFNNPMQPTKNGPIFIPMNRCNVWNMDTGGGFKGKLSIMDIDTKEVWQSDFLKELYPDEKGR